MIIFVIPNLEDMARMRAGNSYKDQYWFSKLHSLISTNSKVELLIWPIKCQTTTLSFFYM